MLLLSSFPRNVFKKGVSFGLIANKSCISLKKSSSGFSSFAFVIVAIVNFQQDTNDVGNGNGKDIYDSYDNDDYDPCSVPGANKYVCICIVQQEKINTQRQIDEQRVQIEKMTRVLERKEFIWMLINK